MISVDFQGKPFNTTVIQVYAQTSNAKEAEAIWFYEDLQDLLELPPKIDIIFIIGNWNAKVESQEIPGVTDKFGLGVQNEAVQKLTAVFPRECTGYSKHSLPTTQEMTLYMDITRSSILNLDSLYSLQPKMKVLYSQQKQNLTVLTRAQIRNFLLQNSDIN